MVTSWTVAQALMHQLAQIPNVLSDPWPVVEILEFNLNGPKLAVRPFCANENYWQVYFETNRVIREVGTGLGLNAPMQHVVVHSPFNSAVVNAPGVVQSSVAVTLGK